MAFDHHQMRGPGRSVAGRPLPPGGQKGPDLGDELGFDEQL